MNTLFTQYHKLSAKDFLDKLAQDQGFAISPPIDVAKITSLIGAVIDESLDLDRIGISGSVSINNKHPVIWINPLESNYEPRKRFTIAHEIGHLILHIDPDIGIKEFIDTNKTLNRDASYWDAKEYEANNFAAQLLMPISLLKEHGQSIIDKYKSDNDSQTMPKSSFIHEMASLFNVSEPAMTFRLNNIGAI